MATKGLTVLLLLASLSLAGCADDRGNAEADGTMPSPSSSSSASMTASSSATSTSSGSNSTGPDPEVVQEMSCNVAAGVGPPGGPGDSFEVPAPTGTVWVGGCEIGALAQDATLTIAHVSGTCQAQLTPEAVFEIGTAYPADTVFEFLCDMTTPPNTTLHIAFSA